MYQLIITTVSLLLVGPPLVKGWRRYPHVEAEVIANLQKRRQQP